jgi:hypothetical protein
MNALGNGRSGYWSPAAPRPLPSPYALSRPNRPALGQQEFLESPILAIGVDTVTAISSAYLAWGLGAVRNKWSTFWWVVSGVATVKALHDMSRVGETK